MDIFLDIALCLLIVGLVSFILKILEAVINGLMEAGLSTMVPGIIGTIVGLVGIFFCLKAIHLLLALVVLISQSQ